MVTRRFMNLILTTPRITGQVPGTQKSVSAARVSIAELVLVCRERDCTLSLTVLIARCLRLTRSPQGGGPLASLQAEEL